MSDDEDDMEQKLPTSKKLPTSTEKLQKAVEKLHDGDELTNAEMRLLLPISMPNLAIKLSQVSEERQTAAGLDLDRRKVEALEQLLQQQRQQPPPGPDNQLFFTDDDLEQYTAHRKTGLAKKSLYWIDQSSEALWDCTKGEISHKSMTALRTFALNTYSSPDSHSKLLGFAAGFLKFLAKTKIEPNYLSFEIYLERPRIKKVKKAITERIITREDVEKALRRINDAEDEGRIVHSKARNYRAFLLLAAYTGLRPSTIERLTVAQLRAALKEEKQSLHVLAHQEKNRIEHYVPIHPTVAAAIEDVLKHDFGEKDDAELFFMFNSFIKWLERQKIPLPRVRDSSKSHLWLSDLRKFAEQYGDIIGWDATNRKYVLAHGMTGVDWEHYKHPLPEDVYDIYMRYWRDVDLS